ncbi:hypothetical protein RYX36_033891, partial [Vicia faba]
ALGEELSIQAQFHKRAYDALTLGGSDCWEDLWMDLAPDEKCWLKKSVNILSLQCNAVNDVKRRQGYVKRRQGDVIKFQQTASSVFIKQICKFTTNIIINGGRKR